MINDDAEEQSQADGRYHPSAAQVAIHVRVVVFDQRNKAQGDTGDSSDTESDDYTGTTLRLRQG